MVDIQLLVGNDVYWSDMRCLVMGCCFLLRGGLSTTLCTEDALLNLMALLAEGAEYDLSLFRREMLFEHGFRYIVGGIGYHILQPLIMLARRL